MGGRRCGGRVYGRTLTGQRREKEDGRGRGKRELNKPRGKNSTACLLPLLQLRIARRWRRRRQGNGLITAGMGGRKPPRWLETRLLRRGRARVSIPVRVLGLPVPQVPTHRLQRFPGLESELLLREGGVCGEVWNVTRSVRVHD
jgi:hypothetical protein